MKCMHGQVTRLVCVRAQLRAEPCLARRGCGANCEEEGLIV